MATWGDGAVAVLPSAACGGGGAGRSSRPGLGITPRVAAWGDGGVPLGVMARVATCEGGPGLGEMGADGLRRAEPSKFVVELNSWKICDRKETCLTQHGCSLTL